MWVNQDRSKRTGQSTGAQRVKRRPLGPVRRRLRIAIATAGRFHVLDLARELHALGHHVSFYSYVPRARARRFGLPDECHVSLLPLVLPAVVCERMLPRLVPRMRERVLNASLNR